MASVPGVPSRESLMRAIDGVPWDHLAHAYAAARDAPEQLRSFVLAERSSDELESAVDWLWGSILHQGSVYSASPPVLWVLVDLLAAFPDHPATEDILSGLATLAEGCLLMREEPDASTDVPVRCNAPGDPVWEVWVNAPLPHAQDGVPEEYFLACRVRASCIAQAVAHAVPVVASCLDHPSDHVRGAAGAAWWSVVQVVPNAPNAKGLLEGMIGNARFEPGVWLSAIIGLDLIGQSVAPLLQDDDRRIRLGAAMAKGTRDMKSSTDELTRALRDLEWLEHTFPQGLAHGDMHLRFHVLSALLERCSPETAGATVIDALGHLITQRASAFTADFEWGPILLWVFPERRAKLPIRDEEMLPLPQRLAAAQRVVLDALTKKSDIWDRRWGNASLALRRVQLPHDRASILQCLAAAER
jgi:hypothetical protein